MAKKKLMIAMILLLGISLIPVKKEFPGFVEYQAIAYKITHYNANSKSRSNYLSGTEFQLFGFLTLSHNLVSTFEPVADIRGQIIEIASSKDYFVIEVAGEVAADTRYAEAKVHVDENTIIELDQLNRASTVADLSTNQQIEVVFANTKHKYGSVEAVAKQIRILTNIGVN